MSNNLIEKIVVVTGGASGIGFGIADCFLQNGVKTMIILDINEVAGNKATADLASKHGDRVVYIKCDVTVDLEETWEKIITTHTNIDILINNAGCLAEYDFRKIIEVNTLAVMNWSLKFWEYARKDNNGRGGTIINIASVCSYRITPHFPMYQTSKFAVLGFTKSIGHMYNFNTSSVRVVAVCPGITRTNMNIQPVPWSGTDDDIADNLKTWLLQDTKDVANAVLEVFEKAESGTAWEVDGAQPVVEV